MNLMSFIGRGVAASGVIHLKTPAQRREEAAIEQARRQWVRALRSDELRTWSAIGDADISVLRGLSVTLTLAGMCKTFDARDADTPATRVIRGGISVVQECISRCDGVISADHARAISASIQHAIESVEAASHGAIAHAAVSMRKLTGADQ